MRELSFEEQVMRLITVHNQREQFRIGRTSTMPEWENDGFEPVYPVRYDTQNKWSL